MGGKVSESSGLLYDAGGNILPMAAAAMLVMAALVGGGVDMSRAYKVQNRLQNACDSGVLAGRRGVTTNGFDAAAKAQAERFFNINFDQAQQGTHSTVFLVAGDTQGNSIGGHASTQMDMLIMQLFGFGTMNIGVNCASTMGVGNSDVTMVLDVTGSMGSSLGTGTRLSALKTAMKNFYNTVATASQGTNARVRYSFVPFSTTVNVGHILNDIDPAYLVDNWTIQSREAVFKTVTQTVFDSWGTPVLSSSSSYSSVYDSSTTRFDSTQYRSLSSCTNALPANSDWADYGSSSTSTSTTTNGSGQQVVTTRTDQPQRMTSYVCQKSGSRYYVYYYTSSRTLYTYNYATSDPIYKTITSQVFDHFDYKPVQYDVSHYKKFETVSTNTGSNGTAVSSTWEGCIEERQTTAASSISYSALTGMTPSDAFDLDIDSAPTGDDATKWAPLWPEVAYYRSSLAVRTSGSQATSYCVPQAQLLQTMDQSSFYAYANSLTAQGNTYLDIGLLWGARLSSPDGIVADLVNEAPANGGNVNRHIIFMTDGYQQASNTTYQSYGIEYLDRRVTSDGSTSQEDARHSLRFRAVCDAIKAKGVRVWVIGFTSGLTADLAYCASPNSSYTANSATELNNAFQEIAKQVGELRVLS